MPQTLPPIQYVFAEDISRDIVKRKNVSLEAPGTTENLLSLILETGVSGE